ncbi:DUF3267 domain-containing protein [Evansella tamaricis]|uniref:DUF3267 domain-containing protein n=1 Tax=Evansella tamaricis TaxID=2069301 RepID=A0ABS6JG33_9BACI|nr:DUF3267 domain-containing protein [Evansella tamaricis]MBU9712651.1 DUF3267 domain-containing protein [Evansella tamaricis]
MNCWKTISIENDFGKERLWFLSATMMIAYFMFFFVIFRTFVSTATLEDLGILFLLITLIIVIPLHLFLHCLPIWISGKKASFGFRKKQWPYFYFSTKLPLTKQLIIISTSSPVIVITSASIIASIIYPQWVHYIAMMSALNFGLCIYDIVTIKHLMSAPKESFIEEHGDGYHILYYNQTIQ